MIAHGREDKYYRGILKGDVEVEQDDDENIVPELDHVEIAAAELEPLADELEPDELGEAHEAVALHGIEDAVGDGSDVEVLEVESELARELHTGHFGCVTISVKKPGYPGSSTHGGFQPSCPFHKLSHNSGCKRYFKIKGPTLRDQNAAAAMSAWWCLKHSMFVRQRDHLRCDMIESDCPSVAWLMERKIVDAPLPGTVKTDDCLDAEEEFGVIEEARGRGGAARGRSRRARGRGRAAELGAVGPDAGVEPEEEMPRARGRSRAKARGRGGRGRARGGALVPPPPLPPPAEPPPADDLFDEVMQESSTGTSSSAGDSDLFGSDPSESD